MKSLKSCPFCGGAADYIERYAKNGKSWFVCAKCSICGTQTKPQFVDCIDELEDDVFNERASSMEDRIADFWNRRCDE